MKKKGWNLSSVEQTSEPEAVSSGPEMVQREPPVLEIENNRIYFYSEIEREKILKLNKELKKMDNNHISDCQTLGVKELTPIYLHINSGGGCIFSGFSGMDNILQCKSDVITIVDGICASAATYLSIVGKKRLIFEHSFMMIHQIQSSFWGKYEELKDETRNLDKYMKLLKNVYIEYTKLPEQKINEILKRDLMFDAKQCLKYGLVDEII